MRFEEVEEFTDEEMLFLTESEERDGFVRTPEMVRWMICHPWFLANRKNGLNDKRYFFLGHDKVVTFRLFRAKDRASGKICAAMVLSFVDRNGFVTCKLLDMEVTDVERRGRVSMWCLSQAIRLGANEFIANGSDLTLTRFGSILARFGKKEFEVYSFSAQNADFAKSVESLTESRTTDGDLPFW